MSELPVAVARDLRSGVVILIMGNESSRMTPDEARELADTLHEFADAARIESTSGQPTD